jgi:predicted lipid-binding transport protein (Tim44 family)
MFEKRWLKRGLILFIFYFLSFYVFPMDALARVGGGRSSGSRGTRSYSPPRSSPAPSPSQPSKPSQPASPSQPLPQTVQQPQGGGFLRGLAGGIVGGMIGGMLFRSLGFAGDFGGSGSGIGLFEILLIGALLFGIYWYFKKRRQAALANQYYQSSVETVEPSSQTSYGSTGEPRREEEWNVDKGLSYIRQMDSSFDQKNFLDASSDQFFKIQGAWANRDMSGVKNVLTEEMYRIIQGDAERLKSDKKINRLDNIAVRSVDIVEAWQESGKDFVTVRFHANLLDYTTDETTGQVVSGSKTEPVKFEEYWTFTRPVGNHPWQLSAINQAE